MKRFYAALGVFFVIALVILLKVRDFSLKEVENSVVETSESTQTYDEYKLKRLAELMQSAKPLKCTFKNDLEGSEVSGAIYIDGTRMRVDMAAPNSKNVRRLSHTIFKDTLAYLWYDDMTTGMTMKTSPDTVETTESVDNQNDRQNMAVRVAALLSGLDYNCQLWEKEEIMFNLPLGIKFVDSETFNKMYSAALCNKCDEETEEASRLLCRKMLKCE